MEEINSCCKAGVQPGKVCPILDRLTVLHLRLVIRFIRGSMEGFRESGSACRRRAETEHQCDGTDKDAIQTVR